MFWRLIAALQAPATPALLPITYRLPAGTTAPVSCAGKPAAGDEIVVCARPRSADRYRYRPVEGDYAEGLPRAETSLFGGAAKGSIDLTSVKRPDGTISNRAMVTLKVPF